jgi:hypothetical protein
VEALRAKATEVELLSVSLVGMFEGTNLMPTDALGNLLKGLGESLVRDGTIEERLARVQFRLECLCTVVTANASRLADVVDPVGSSLSLLLQHVASQMDALTDANRHHRAAAEARVAHVHTALGRLAAAAITHPTSIATRHAGLSLLGQLMAASDGEAVLLTLVALRQALEVVGHVLGAREWERLVGIAVTQLSQEAAGPRVRSGAFRLVSLALRDFGTSIPASGLLAMAEPLAQHATMPSTPLNEALSSVELVWAAVDVASGSAIRQSAVAGSDIAEETLDETAAQIMGTRVLLGALDALAGVATAAEVPTEVSSSALATLFGCLCAHGTTHLRSDPVTWTVVWDEIVLPLTIGLTGDRVVRVPSFRAWFSNDTRVHGWREAVLRGEGPHVATLGATALVSTAEVVGRFVAAFIGMGDRYVASFVALLQACEACWWSGCVPLRVAAATAVTHLFAIRDYSASAAELFAVTTRSAIAAGDGSRTQEERAAARANRPRKPRDTHSLPRRAWTALGLHVRRMIVFRALFALGRWTGPSPDPHSDEAWLPGTDASWWLRAHGPSVIAACATAAGSGTFDGSLGALATGVCDSWLRDVHALKLTDAELVRTVVGLAGFASPLDAPRVLVHLMEGGCEALVATHPREVVTALGHVLLMGEACVWRQSRRDPTSWAAPPALQLVTAGTAVAEFARWSTMFSNDAPPSPVRPDSGRQLEQWRVYPKLTAVYRSSVTAVSAAVPALVEHSESALVPCIAPLVRLYGAGVPNEPLATTSLVALIPLAAAALASADTALLPRSSLDQVWSEILDCVQAIMLSDADAAVKSSLLATLSAAVLEHGAGVRLLPERLVDVLAEGTGSQQPHQVRLGCIAGLVDVAQEGADAGAGSVGEAAADAAERALVECTWAAATGATEGVRVAAFLDWLRAVVEVELVEISEDRARRREERWKLWEPAGSGRVERKPHAWSRGPKRHLEQLMGVLAESVMSDNFEVRERVKEALERIAR